jgi:endonuclease/exonuclease/phosphatase family metal-dependent hydrolase
MSSGPSDAASFSPALTLLQSDVEERKACYHEALVRDAYLTHPNWIRELGWGPEDEKRYYTITTACEVLRYRRPNILRCAALRAGGRPQVPLNDDKNVYRGLARLELAERFPERAAELFPWRKENASPANYWRNAIGDLHALFLLEELADFDANVFLRLIYLHGEVPQQLPSPWRARPTRSLNFDESAQASIEAALRGFKFWHDESFRAIDEQTFRVARRDQHVRDMEKRNEGHRASGEKEEEITGADRDPNDSKFKYEMTYWSENHQILFATAEYLAGQWMPGATFHPGERYRDGGPAYYRDFTGRERMERARIRLDNWFDDRLRFGMSEWNAPGYYAEHILALTNLADFALDESIHTRASMVLDLIIFDLARFTHEGSFSVAASRSHFKHKNCGWQESPGDLVEILFGTRNGAFSYLDALSACAFASARRYTAPDALLHIGRARPAHWIDRTRASIDWAEAGEYGIGFTSEPDVMRWWSRASWFTKHVINSTRKIVEKYGLQETPPFKDILPKTGAAADALSGVKIGAYVAAGPAFPLLIPLLGDPLDQEDEIADALSIITEGSAYTRGNIYTYRNRHAMLSSQQNHHAGQLSFQGNACQATLNMCATVFTSHPSAGGGIDKAIGQPLGIIGGSTLGFLAGGLLGPAGSIAGGIYGGIKGSEALSKDVQLLPADSDGPDWWTGSVTNPRVVQMKGAAILAYKPKAFQLTLFGHRFHAWFPQDAFDDLPEGIKGEPPKSIDARKERSGQYFPFRKPGACNVETGRWVFGRAGDGYIGLFSGQIPAWTHDGDEACKEIMVKAERNIFIIQIGDAEEFGSYQKFVDRVLRARIHINGLNWKLSDFECSYDIPNGSRLELHYDDDQVRYAGLPFSDDEFPRLESSFAQVAWQQTKYVIQYGGSSLTHDVKRRRRTTGGAVSGVDIEADLRIYGQNMGLFYKIAPYAGTERDKALGKLIAELRAEKFDVVGLSEMWHLADRERILREVGDIYTYHVEGPDETDATDVGAFAAGAATGAAASAATGIPAVGGAIGGGILGASLLLDGGLFLLSRHKIIASDATIYRNCAGEDCGSEKGALHARIQPLGLPCPIDIFLSHTQNLTPKIDQSKARSALAAQVRQLGAFVQSCRDHRCPALLLGDLNVDALDESDRGLLDHLYAELQPTEDLLPTFKPPESTNPPKHPEATSERTDSGVSSFNSGTDPREVADPKRFSDAAQRLDYLFSWEGTLFAPAYDDRNVVVYQSSPGRDMSDHYGVQTRLATITQRLPAADTPLRFVSLRISRFWCLETTSGPGDDEVQFTLRGIAANGSEQSISTELLEDVDAGHSERLELAPLVISDPGEFLIVAISGTESDDLSADDSLGTASVWLARQELVERIKKPSRRVLPRLTGDGGQYAVEVEIVVE